MADAESKFSRKLMKIFTKGFFGSLITNPTSDFKNLRWRIQYGVRRSVTYQEYSWECLLRSFSGSWLRIWRRIHNQRPKKSLGEYFHKYSWKITFRCPPCWIRHIWFWKCNVEFVISDPESLFSPNLKLLSWIDSLKMNFFETSTIFVSLFIYKPNTISNYANLTVYLCYFIT